MKNDQLPNNTEKNNIEKKENNNNKLNNLKKNDNLNNEKIINKYEKKNTIEDLKKKNDSYKFEIIKLKNKIQEHKNNIWDLKLRSQAEIENIKHRSLLDIEKAYKFSLEKFINELLPVIDNLERAINFKIKQKNEINLSIIEGIKLTLKSLLILIKKFGVSVINEVNIPFDPSKHQAMSLIESNNIKENYIIEVLQKGYFLNKRLLRPAMVIVSKIKKIKDKN
ncbi:nucleotide exchange factor GrpE [Enterobacteriaceae endosymbiont of Donacia bicoloricornis]|uniref:nucleotide exchange factor GrpE n=1 Tax=Enterobacteriaceae endosymbiont of Donacia bicoloricornis TaxID=2675772 RepID=UPI00144A00F5|nr:nucleotide exchange factor GrpE [Enterobacteriaceae endosymbiont of Donacia bicoloricornis]QJC37894.1 nucleotide exchange factor GrpE [Enterobacteriaceae endosymbiont of Donacia bicoloricornis]